MQRDARSPADYVRQVEAPQKALLQKIRRVIKKTVPTAREGLEHGMLDYVGLANLGAQKHYVALYVAPAVLAKHKPNFPGVSAGKSCLRFRNIEQADEKALVGLLRDVKKYRAQKAD